MENKELVKKCYLILQNYPYIKPAIDKILEKGNELELLVGKSANDEMIFAQEKNGHLYYLNSRYNCINEIDILLSNIKALENPFSPIIIFGMGNAMIIHEVRRRFPENYIYIHEPDIKVFKTVIDSYENIDFLSDDHVILTVGQENRGAMIELLHEMIDQSNFSVTDIICMPQYEILWENEYLDFLKLFYARCEQIIMQKNTDIIFNDEHIINFWENITDLINQYSVGDLIELLKNKQEKAYPAFIVSAGPSLDKNIEELKNIKGRGIIMAVDTAIKPLLKHGIVPDIIASVDPHKPLSLFEYEGVEKIPMLVDINYNSQIANIHKGKRFYAWSGEPFIKDFLGEMNINLGLIESGGSVACNLFSLAVFCGFKTIILVGQDLAYPDKKGHSSASYDDEKEIDYSSKKYFEVEDINGGKVFTEGNMNAYRKWFEACISRKPDIHYIDATEGGAKIYGTEICTLKMAIEECCDGMSPQKWMDIINSSKPLMNEEQKQISKKRLCSLPKNMKKISELLDESASYIKEANQCLTKNNYDGLTENMKNIIEINNMLDESLEVKLLNLYTPNSGYAVSMAAYNIKKNKKDDIKNLLKLCDILNKGYKEALNKSCKDIDEKIKDMKMF